MRLAVVFLLVASCATPTPEHRVMPDSYTDCGPRFDHYLCCDRDFETHRVIGECYKEPKGN